MAAFRDQSLGTFIDISYKFCIYTYSYIIILGNEGLFSHVKIVIY